MDVVFHSVLSAHRVARWCVHPPGRSVAATVSDTALLGKLRKDVVKGRVPGWRPVGKLVGREGVARGSLVPGVTGLTMALTMASGMNLTEHARAQERGMPTDVLPGGRNQPAVIKASRSGVIEIARATVAIIRVVHVVLIIAVVAIVVPLHQRLLGHAAQRVDPVPRHGGPGMLPPWAEVQREAKRRRCPSLRPGLKILLKERVDTRGTPSRVRPRM